MNSELLNLDDLILAPSMDNLDLLVIATQPEVEIEVESIEQQALKLRFIQELTEAADKTNKQIDLPKKNNGTLVETEANLKKDKAAIRLYSNEKINDIIRMLQNPPKSGCDDREALNKYYYNRSQFYLTTNDPVQLAKIEKKDTDRLHPRIVENMFDKCLEIHKNIGYQGTAGMSREANKLYYNITRLIMTIFLKYSNEYQIKRRKIKTAGQLVRFINQ